MELRTLTREETESALPIWSQAFERGDREMADWKEWYEEASSRIVTFGVSDAAGLQAVVLIENRPLMMGPDATVPMAAVGGVACLPAARGKGYAGACLRYMLEQAKERGISTSMLFPFSWAYYRRFGYEWVGRKRRYTIPTREMRTVPETENVRAAAAGEWETLNDVYEAFAKRYRGALTRPQGDWKHMLDGSKKEHTYTYLYERDGRAEGYLTFRGGKDEKTYLREFIALNATAQRALLGLLKRHEMQTEKFEWLASEDDSLWSYGYHWDIETKLVPATQARVVDVPVALAAWKPEAAARGSVTLAVQDESAPWNTGTWRIEFADRAVEVRPTNAEPQVSLDIQALSQAYWGTPNPDALRAADRLTVHDAAGFAALKALLAGPEMWMNDDF